MLALRYDLAGDWLRAGGLATPAALAVFYRSARQPTGAGDFLAPDRTHAQETGLPPPPAPNRPGLRIGDAFVAIGLAAILYLGVQLAVGAPTLVAGPEISLSPAALPYYSLRSLVRMTAAYLLSLAFTLVYGYAAARSRRAEAVLVPILDVLQSVPILSFLPIVLLAMVAIFPEGLGVELAAIVLIFTSQVWNLTFSFYNSLLTVPKELHEAASVFRLNWWLRFKSVEVPFATIGLIWNSMMSWAGGWFFLMAAEQFQLGDRNFQLPGIGSYLKTAANQGDLSALAIGIAALVGLIVALDQLLWRPLIAWSDRFKLQLVEEEFPPRSWMLDLLSRSTFVEWLGSRLFLPLTERLDRAFARSDRGGTSAVDERGAAMPGRQDLASLIGSLALGVLGLAAIYGGAQAVILVAQIDVGGLLFILLSAGATFLRVVAALAIAVAWTVPVGVAIGTNHRLANRLLPVTQVAASVPATALFPALLLVFIGLTGGLNIAAIVLMLLGTQWYLLFNVIAGAMAIPEDLFYTTESLRVRGFERWRSFILPAIFPYLITGMITATGGAWNASIVSEYVRFAGQTYETIGIGALIAASSEAADYPVLVAATLTMVAIVVLLNRLIWRRLYALAEGRFRLD